VLAGGGRLWAGAPAPDEAAAGEVMRLAHTLSQAFAKGDAAAVRLLLADDSVAVFGSGRPETKADQLRKLAHLRVERASLEDVQAIPISQDVVAVSFRLERKATLRGKALTPEVEGLAVWARRDGRWQQVTYQETQPERP
jgi:Domain of unknown function (DUF4440)